MIERLYYTSVRDSSYIQTTDPHGILHTIQGGPMTIRDRIIAYWKGRSAEFGVLRKKELTSDLAPRWLREITPHIKDHHQRILDLGTGTGYRTSGFVSRYGRLSLYGCDAVRVS